MNVIPQTRMTVDEFLAWAQTQPGKYELHNGRIFMMSPEGAGHAKLKFAVQTALAEGIRARGLPCHMLPDGMTVRTDPRTTYEPDALVYCGEEVAPSSVEIPNPMIIVEVLSRSTRHVDTAIKLPAYFRVPSVMHYLLFDPTEPLIICHTRSAGDAIVTRSLREGVITLDPPGFEIAVKDVYGQ